MLQQAQQLEPGIRSKRNTIKSVPTPEVLPFLAAQILSPNMTTLLSIPILTVDPARILPHQRSIKHRTKNATSMLQKKCSKKIKFQNQLACCLLFASSIKPCINMLRSPLQGVLVVLWGPWRN